MPLVRSKQIDKYITGRIYINNAANIAMLGVSANITTVLTTALSTASDKGTAVPLQAYIAGTQPGLQMLPPKNLVELFDSTTKQKLKDNTAEGNELFGRLTAAAGVYTLTIYSMINGVETVYATQNALSLDIVVPYVFTFETLPSDFATSLKTAYTNDDPRDGARQFEEVLPVTALNTLTDLTHKYTAGPATINVNGQILSTLGASPAFTLTANAKTVTWSQTNAGFALETTDFVVVKYPY